MRPSATRQTNLNEKLAFQSYQLFLKARYCGVSQQTRSFYTRRCVNSSSSHTKRLFCVKCRGSSIAGNGAIQNNADENRKMQHDDDCWKSLHVIYVRHIRHVLFGAAFLCHILLLSSTRPPATTRAPICGLWRRFCRRTRRERFFRAHKFHFYA